VQGNLNELLKELPPELARATARYGVRLAIDLLETLYADLGGEREPEKPARKKLGRPRKAPAEEEAPTVRTVKLAVLADTRAAAAKSGWPADPEERKREMARRIEVRAERLAAERRSATARKRWENMSPAKREAWARAMQRGKKRAVKHAKTDKETVAA
jgi:hypothetical protein